MNKEGAKDIWEYLKLSCHCGSIKCGKIMFSRLKLEKNTIITIGMVPYKHRNVKDDIVLGEEEIDKIKKFLK